MPLVLIQTTLRLRWPGVQNLYDDWANVTYYGLFFLLGFVVARWPAWETVIAREWRRAGMIGLAACLMLPSDGSRSAASASRRLAGRPLALTLAMHALTAPAGYCLVVALLGAAREHLASRRPGAGVSRRGVAPDLRPAPARDRAPGLSSSSRRPLGVAVKLALLLATSVTLTLAPTTSAYGARRRLPALGGRGRVDCLRGNPRTIDASRHARLEKEIRHVESPAARPRRDAARERLRGHQPPPRARSTGCPARASSTGTRTRSTCSRSRGASGRTSARKPVTCATELTVTKLLNAASPALALAALIKQRFAEARLLVREKTGDIPSDLVTITMRNVAVVRYQTGGAETDNALKESVGLGLAEFTVSYQQQGPNGDAVGPPRTFTYQSTKPCLKN